jgi:hypothetical protein
VDSSTNLKSPRETFRLLGRQSLLCFHFHFKFVGNMKTTFGVLVGVLVMAFVATVSAIRGEIQSCSG